SAENLALLVEAEAREGPGEVRAGRGLDAPGLQREAAAGTADEPVGADTDTEARFARGADIGARERALLHVMPLHGEDQPLDMRALGKADVEADLCDRALIDFGLVALAVELAGHVLLRADDVANTGIDFAREAPDLDATLVGGRGSGCDGKNGCGKCRGGELLHSWYPQVDPHWGEYCHVSGAHASRNAWFAGLSGSNSAPFPIETANKDAVPDGDGATDLLSKAAQGRARATVAPARTPSRWARLRA